MLKALALTGTLKHLNGTPGIITNTAHMLAGNVARVAALIDHSPFAEQA